MLVATALLAAVSLAAAFVAIRAVRQVRSAVVAPTEDTSAQVVAEEPSVTGEVELAQPQAPTHRIVEGRVIVQPTREQVIGAAMTRPGVRLSVYLHGVAHALRPESRDRLRGIMRREYRARRRARLKAGRRAVKAQNPDTSSTRWLSS